MKLVVPVLFALAVSACGSSRSSRDVLPETDVSLIGSWIWVETSGGKTGSVRTPETEGYALTIEFRKDSTFQFLQNQEVWAEGNWTLLPTDRGQRLHYRLASEPTGRTVVSWTGLGSPPGHWVRLDADHLVLEEGCCDRYTHQFTRAR